MILACSSVYLQPLTDLSWDIDDNEIPKCSRLCLVMFAWNTVYTMCSCDCTK